MGASWWKNWKKWNFRRSFVKRTYEELKMKVIIEDGFDECIFEYPDKTIKLIALNCIFSGDGFSLVEHEDAKWADVDELDNYEFAPANQYFVKKIKELKNSKNDTCDT